MLFVFGIIAAIVLIFILGNFMGGLTLWAFIVIIFAMIFSMFYRLKEIYEDVKLIKVHLGLHDPVMEEKKAVEESEHELERKVERQDNLDLDSINQEIEQELEASMEMDRESDRDEQDKDK